MILWLIQVFLFVPDFSHGVLLKPPDVFLKTWIIRALFEEKHHYKCDHQFVYNTVK